MEKLNDLRALLGHMVEDLYSAETQILDALPLMIAKAKSPELKGALQEHLDVTRGQVERLEEVRSLLDDKTGKESKGLLKGLFSGGDVKCLAMEGIIKEAKHHMKEDMSPEVMDAAIIGIAQKVEHYEICGYGTARAFAQQLELNAVAELLEETLDEEYEADDRLTDIAVNGLNQEAEEVGTEEEAEVEEPELQMVSNPRAASKGSTGTGGRKSPAPSKAAGTRSGSTTPRTTPANPSRSTSAQTKSSTTPASRSSAGKKSTGGRSSSGSARGRK